ncbi:MAG: hypothetical protein EHM58_07995 [Ignavibacteriae bacterium]|nr:MAG: hypothetical protein EHM58_07995 [Ignavibacteriota bacterium]
MNKKLQVLLIKTFLISLPLMLLLAYYVIEDPFKVIHHYDSFYKNDVRLMDLNRDYTSTSLFLNNYPVYHYDSFIFGSSRSLTFQCTEWQKYVTSPTYHFDANGESLFGVYIKIKYLYEHNMKIKNCIIVVDSGLIAKTNNSDEYIYMKDPETSGESRIKFQFEFMKKFLNNKFFPQYFAYKAGKKLPEFLEYFPIVRRWSFNFNNITNDVIYSEQEKIIQENKELYYKKSNNTFYKRDFLNEIMYPGIIKQEQLKMLYEIKDIFNKFGTSFKIIVYPDYNLVKFNNEDLHYLENIFGSENVYDYSGINEITRNEENYVDFHHARSLVGDKILKEIYTEKNELK